MVQSIHIDNISNHEYDKLLATGWFRSREVIYRSDLICLDQRVSSVRHIRYDLEKYDLKKRHRRLLNKNSNRFRVEISSVNITPDIERLYDLQRTRFKGFIHSEITGIVYGGEPQSSLMISQLNIYDGNLLVASSFFDVGSNSAASIICVCDPEYSRYSLGIYTMLLEIEYMCKIGVRYYYPGYILDKPSCFDYKLKFGNCQWLSKDGGWYDDIPEADRKTKAMLLDEKMAELRLRLAIRGHAPSLIFYPYFTAAYLSSTNGRLVKYSCYFKIETDEFDFAAAYDFERDSFVVFFPYASNIYEVDTLELSEDYRSNSNYELRVMQTDSIYLLTEFALRTAVRRLESLSI